MGVVPDPVPELLSPQAASSRRALRASKQNKARLIYFRVGTVPKVFDLFGSIFSSSFREVVHGAVTIYSASSMLSMPSRLGRRSIGHPPIPGLSNTIYEPGLLL